MSERVGRDANRELRARFDDVYGQYQQLRSNLDHLAARLAELRVTRRSSDGTVTATVGARGELVSLDLTPAIYRDRDAAALSRKITETVSAATSAAAAATRDVVAETVPAGSGSVDFLRTGDFGALLGRADAVLGRGEGPA
ncbi:YbaB/EbfC family nucleoid-associated protein [Micromonospora profundi]|uniref:YbaB/EbfC family nucleoid-associated protein n=1 Tax=Micromonospora profundi TaxID=1420889 RepID=A0AAJ6L5M6_9ACTN|nr:MULTISPECIES: YbaB/EbfC family nucleoid-associated protein [Micromonospora]NJC14554.1 DNA-binding protein YbaB [Micromonospora profundi]WLS46108.1 YbaB/EbfC family nucleoid-associated protein [Micromonospora profundi]